MVGQPENTMHVKHVVLFVLDRSARSVLIRCLCVCVLATTNTGFGLIDA